MTNKIERATFGAGCFWGVEELFRKVSGMISTAVGYMGGTPPKLGETVTYEEVCTDMTGHAEVVQVEYDPEKVPYENLLAIFWENHDPTTPNRQGLDTGTQYRSVIFYHTPAQKASAEKLKHELETEKKYPRPIITEIVPASTFFRAEEYHQRYFEKRGGGTCHI